MKRIYFWGAGYWAEYVYKKIKEQECEILGMIDSDEKKQNKEWKYGLMVCPPERLLTSVFDCIIITPRQFEHIQRQCLEMGISKDKILVYWRDSDFVDILENRSMVILSLEKENEKLVHRLENIPYEYGLEKLPVIKSGKELLRHILRSGGSLSRFGDGEFELMLERPRPWFQDTDKQLADRLKEIILAEESEDIAVAIADEFGSLEKYNKIGADDIREYLTRKTRESIMKFINLEREYYDAFVTRPYLIYKDKKNAAEIFGLFKEIWQGRNVILVEGRYARIGIGNDLFSSAASVRRILCPPKNAWNKYDEIMQSVRNHAGKNDLICVSLGPTATVMAYDLSKEGMQVLDIGQVDTEYEWFLRKADKRIAISGKMVAEVFSCFENSILVDNRYDNQIADVIRE